MSESRRAKGERSQFGERGEDKAKRERSHLVPMDSESSPRDFPLFVWRVRDGSGTEKNQEKQGVRESACI